MSKFNLTGICDKMIQACVVHFKKNLMTFWRFYHYFRLTCVFIPCYVRTVDDVWSKWI